MAAPPSPESPDVPEGLPAIVYMSSAVIDWPHCDPDDDGISWIRLLPVSATYRLPPEAARASGVFSSAEVAAPPSPSPPRCRSRCPRPCTRHRQFIEIPHCVPVATGISRIRLSPVVADIQVPRRVDGQAGRDLQQRRRRRGAIRRVALDPGRAARDHVHVPCGHRDPPLGPVDPATSRTRLPWVSAMYCSRPRRSPRRRRTSAATPVIRRRRCWSADRPSGRCRPAPARPRSGTTPSHRSTRTPSAPACPPGFPAAPAARHRCG